MYPGFVDDPCLSTPVKLFFVVILDGDGDLEGHSRFKGCGMDDVASECQIVSLGCRALHGSGVTRFRLMTMKTMPECLLFAIVAQHESLDDISE